jgi:hypothetical protein
MNLVRRRASSSSSERSDEGNGISTVGLSGVDDHILDRTIHGNEENAARKAPSGDFVGHGSLEPRRRGRCG